MFAKHRGRFVVPESSHVTRFRRESLTSTVLLAQVREPPDISKSHAVTDNTEEKLHLAAPFRSVVLLGLLTVGSILSTAHHDRHVLARLAVLVQRGQLVPIPRGLVLHYHASTRLVPRFKHEYDFSPRGCRSTFLLVGNFRSRRVSAPRFSVSPVRDERAFVSRTLYRETRLDERAPISAIGCTRFAIKRDEISLLSRATTATNEQLNVNDRDDEDVDEYEP